MKISPNEIFNYSQNHEYAMMYFKNEIDPKNRSVEHWIKCLSHEYNKVKILEVEWIKFINTFFFKLDVCRRYDVILLGCGKILEVYSKYDLKILRNAFQQIVYANNLSIELRPHASRLFFSQYDFLLKPCKRTKKKNEEISEINVKMENENNKEGKYSNESSLGLQCASYISCEDLDSISQDSNPYKQNYDLDDTKSCSSVSSKWSGKSTMGSSISKVGFKNFRLKFNDLTPVINRLSKINIYSDKPSTSGSQSNKNLFYNPRRKTQKPSKREKHVPNPTSLSTISEIREKPLNGLPPPSYSSHSINRSLTRTNSQESIRSVTNRMFNRSKFDNTYVKPKRK